MYIRKGAAKIMCTHACRSVRSVLGACRNTTADERISNYCVFFIQAVVCSQFLIFVTRRG